MLTRTFLARSPSALLDRLASRLDALKDHALLFTLTASVDNSPDDLTRLLDVLRRSRGPAGAARVGCLSTPLHDGVISCSILSVDARRANAFRSTLPGTAATQVGRWHALRKAHADGARDDDAEDSGTYTRADTMRTDAVTSVVYLSDAAPQGLCSHLARAYPAAAQAGLHAAPTPFITGLPATLFHNDAVLSSGAVGLELSLPRPPAVSTSFPHLTSITPPATVTRAEGNLVHALDGASPAKLLLAATQRMPEAPGKDAAFFLGVLGADGRVAALHHVVSGDPGRGTMALAADRAPRAGARVQIFCQPAVAAPVTREAPPADDTSRLAFVAAGETPPFAPDLGAHDVLEWTECVAASERGWTLAHGAAENEADGHGAAEDAEAGAHGRDAWTCAAVGGEVRMSLA